MRSRTTINGDLKTEAVNPCPSSDRAFLAIQDRLVIRVLGVEIPNSPIVFKRPSENAITKWNVERMTTNVTISQRSQITKIDENEINHDHDWNRQIARNVTFVSSRKNGATQNGEIIDRSTQNEELNHRIVQDEEMIERSTPITHRKLLQIASDISSVSKAASKFDVSHVEVDGRATFYRSEAKDIFIDILDKTFQKPLGIEHLQSLWILVTELNDKVPDRTFQAIKDSDLPQGRYRFHLQFDAIGNYQIYGYYDMLIFDDRPLVDVLPSRKIDTSHAAIDVTELLIDGEIQYYISKELQFSLFLYDQYGNPYNGNSKYVKAFLIEQGNDANSNALETYKDAFSIEGQYWVLLKHDNVGMYDIKCTYNGVELNIETVTVNVFPEPRIDLQNSRIELSDIAIDGVVEISAGEVKQFFIQLKDQYGNRIGGDVLLFKVYLIDREQKTSPVNLEAMKLPMTYLGRYHVDLRHYTKGTYNITATYDGQVLPVPSGYVVVLNSLPIVDPSQSGIDVAAIETGYRVTCYAPAKETLFVELYDQFGDRIDGDPDLIKVWIVDRSDKTNTIEYSVYKRFGDPIGYFTTIIVTDTVGLYDIYASYEDQLLMGTETSIDVKKQLLILDYGTSYIDASSITIDGVISFYVDESRICNLRTYDQFGDPYDVDLNGLAAYMLDTVSGFLKDLVIQKQPEVGHYSFELANGIPGTYDVFVTFYAIQIDKLSNILIEMRPPVLDLTYSFIGVSNLEVDGVVTVYVLDVNSFFVQLKDQYDNKIEADESPLVVELYNRAKGSAQTMTPMQTNGKAGRSFYEFVCYNSGFYDIHVTYNGEHLANSPVEVSALPEPAKVDAELSTIDVSAIEANGEITLTISAPKTFTVQLLDQYGRNIEGNMTLLEAFLIDTQTETQLKKLGRNKIDGSPVGEYQIVLLHDVVGSYDLMVSYDSIRFPNVQTKVIVSVSPPFVDVNSCIVDASDITEYGSILLYIDEPKEIYVQLIDQYGNAIQGDSSLLKVKFFSKDGSTSSSKMTQSEDPNGPIGRYIVKLKYDVVGTWDIMVTYDGVQIADIPPEAAVEKRPPVVDPKASGIIPYDARGFGILYDLGSSVWMKALLFDQYGSPYNGDPNKGYVLGEDRLDSANDVNFPFYIEDGDPIGKYTFHIVFEKPVTYNLSAYYDDIRLRDPNIWFISQYPAPAIDYDKSDIDASNIAVDNVVTMYLDETKLCNLVLYDQYGDFIDINPLNILAYLVDPTNTVDWKMLTVIKEPEAGRYSIQLQHDIPGSYYINVFHNGNRIESHKVRVDLSKPPAVVDYDNSRLDTSWAAENDQILVYTDETKTIYVQLQDQYGNRIEGDTNLLSIFLKNRAVTSQTTELGIFLRDTAPKGRYYADIAHDKEGEFDIFALYHNQKLPTSPTSYVVFQRRPPEVSSTNSYLTIDYFEKDSENRYLIPILETVNFEIQLKDQYNEKFPADLSLLEAYLENINVNEASTFTSCTITKDPEDPIGFFTSKFILKETELHRVFATYDSVTVAWIDISAQLERPRIVLANSFVFYFPLLQDKKLLLYVGETYYVEVHLKDQYNDDIEAEKVDYFEAVVIDESDFSDFYLVNNITKKDTALIGKYSIYFTPEATGRYTLYVYYKKTKIEPLVTFNVENAPPKVDPGPSYVDLNGNSEEISITTEETATIYLVLIDQYSKKIDVDIEDLNVYLMDREEPYRSGSCEIFKDEDLSKGRYRVVVARDMVGTYELVAMYKYQELIEKVVFVHVSLPPPVVDAENSKVDVSNIVIEDSILLYIGVTEVFYIKFKDQYGSPIDADINEIQAYLIDANGRNSQTLNVTKKEISQTGVYRVQLTHDVQGDYQITVSYKGDEIRGSPVNVTVKHYPDLDPSKSYVDTKGIAKKGVITLEAGEEATFFIIGRNKFSYPIVLETHKLVITLFSDVIPFFVGFDRYDRKLIFDPINAIAITISVTVTGVYKLAVFYDFYRLQVTDPDMIVVPANIIQPNLTIVTGTALGRESWDVDLWVRPAGTELSLVVTAFDPYGNRHETTKPGFYLNQGITKAARWMRALEEGNGKTQFFFTIFNTGKYKIKVFFNKIVVFNTELEIGPDLPLHSNCRIYGIDSIVAGGVGKGYLEVKDTYGNVYTDRYKTKVDLTPFSIKFTPIFFNGDRDPVFAEITSYDSNRSAFVFEYNLTTAGSFKITALWERFFVQGDGSTQWVDPAPADSKTTYISKFPSRNNAGQPFDFEVVAFDAFGNLGVDTDLVNRLQIAINRTFDSTLKYIDTFNQTQPGFLEGFIYLTLADRYTIYFWLDSIRINKSIAFVIDPNDFDPKTSSFEVESQVMAGIWAVAFFFPRDVFYNVLPLEQVVEEFKLRVANEEEEKLYAFDASEISERFVARFHPGTGGEHNISILHNSKIVDDLSVQIMVDRITYNASGLNSV